MLTTAKNLSEPLVAHERGRMRIVDARGGIPSTRFGQILLRWSQHRHPFIYSASYPSIRKVQLLSLPHLRSIDVMTPKPILLCGKSAQIAALFSQLMLPEFQGMSYHLFFAPRLSTDCDLLLSHSRLQQRSCCTKRHPLHAR